MKDIEYQEILRRLAPCGLDCGRCADFEHGEIRKTSARLRQLLGNYGRVARMKTDAKPEFAGYEEFNAILASFSNASCSGCRGDNVECPLDSCQAKSCLKQRPVDFCFECPDYPCEQQFAGSPLRKRWISSNDRMREIGVRRFYRELIETPRYPGNIK
jgi:hypothetical protein